MDTLQCAIVLAKLPLFDWELQQRQRAAARYAERLGSRVRPVGRRTDRSSVYAQYTVMLERREAVQRALQAAGIPTAVHYPVPVHLQPAYATLSAGGDCPTARMLADKVLSLPMGPYLTDADIDRVCTVLLDAVGHEAPAALVLPA